jgi:hypothetical protein
MKKDDAIDRLLRRTEGARDHARTADACLDAETLAALTDGALTADERMAAEAHAADCDRCLAVLAAIATTTPLPSVPQTSSWFSLRWLVPLTTAAVAITVWVIVQEPGHRGNTGETQVVTQADRATEETQKKHGETDRPRLLRDRELEAESRKPREAKPATEETRRKHSLPSERDARPREQEALAKNETAPGTRSGNAAEATQLRGLEDKASPRLDELRRLPGRVAEKPAAPAAPAAAPAARSRKEIAGEPQALMAQRAPAVITSPDPSVRWRLLGTTVERSDDGGRTWTLQPTNTAVELRAGSAPAADVCWIVGRSGLVLLSTDGRTWRLLDFPDKTADLVSITAVDGATATVTAADGRTYRTADAGRTWTLQETLAAPF